MRLLEIGTGSGAIAAEFASTIRGGTVVAVDVLDQRILRAGYEFRLVDGPELPFADGSFDIVVSNHVIEHVGARPAQLTHLREIRRVLTSDGVAYLAVPNRWTLLEPHFRLPLLSWLPPHWRSFYVRLARRGPGYDCNPLSRSELLDAFARAGLAPSDRSFDAIRVMAEIERGGVAGLLSRWAPRWVLRACRLWLPTFIFTLEEAQAEPLRRPDAA